MIGDMQDKNKSKVNEQAKTRGEIFCVMKNPSIFFSVVRHSPM
jgi:hypothetical protein